jgi:hypothetical protein
MTSQQGVLANQERQMAILAAVTQGSAMCAALLESVLTALLYRQVRRYSAEAQKLASPRKRRSSDRTMTTRRKA